MRVSRTIDFESVWTQESNPTAWKLKLKRFGKKNFLLSAQFLELNIHVFEISSDEIQNSKISFDKSKTGHFY